MTMESKRSSKKNPKYKSLSLAIMVPSEALKESHATCRLARASQISALRRQRMKPLHVNTCFIVVFGTFWALPGSLGRMERLAEGQPIHLVNMFDNKPYNGQGGEIWNSFILLTFGHMAMWPYDHKAT